jgi:hypothetical protein
MDSLDSLSGLPGDRDRDRDRDSGGDTATARLRSCSFGDVMDNSNSDPAAKPPPILTDGEDKANTINTATVNNNPQDYVLVNGGAKGSGKAAVRITKSQASSSQASPRPPLTGPGPGPGPDSPICDARRLREELSLLSKEEVIERAIEDQWTILSQAAEIRRLKERMWGAGDGATPTSLGGDTATLSCRLLIFSIVSFN